MVWAVSGPSLRLRTELLQIKDADLPPGSDHSVRHDIWWVTQGLSTRERIGYINYPAGQNEVNSRKKGATS